MERLLISMGLSLILAGIVLATLGFALGARGGRLLPGDIVVSRPGFTFALPIATSLLPSLLLTLVIWVVAAGRR
jgi:hypothetical protein